MNHLSLIIKREYFAKVKNKSFILMTFLSPFIMAGLIGLIVYLTNLNSEKERIISVLDETGFLNDALISTKYTTYNFLDGIELESAKIITNDNAYYGLLYIPDLPLDLVSEKIKFFSKDTPSLTFINNLESKIESRLKEIKLENSGVDLSKIENAKTYVNLNQESFQGVKTSKVSSFMKLAFGLTSGYLLFMFIIIYGNLIMRSVIEEKTSRIIEVIISSVKPIKLMLGKIFGTSLAGITQFIIWVILLGVLLIITSQFFGFDIFSTPQQDVVSEVMNNKINNINPHLF